MKKDVNQKKFLGNPCGDELVKESLQEFNRYMSPEAVAVLIDIKNDKIKVKLDGPFCRTCGVYDYFDDLKSELEKTLDRPLTIARIDGDGEDSYVITYVAEDTNK